MSRRVLHGFDRHALKRLRLGYKRKGISLQDLGRLSEVSDSTLGNWESGSSLPTIDKLDKVLNVLDAPVDKVVKIPPGKRTLADLRVFARLTQPELAKRAGMTTTSLSKLERAETRLTDAKVEVLGPLLGVSTDEIHAAWRRAQGRPPGTPA